MCVCEREREREIACVCVCVQCGLLQSDFLTTFVLYYQGAVVKIKSLEESVEAERAAHLETKFNSEIIQVTVYYISYTKGRLV